MLTTVGVLQQSLIGDACKRILEGEAEVTLVTDGDCGYRLQRAAVAKIDLPEAEQETTPDITLSPSEELRHPAEVRAGLRMPVGLFAFVHSAYLVAVGRPHADLPRGIAALFNRFSVAVVDNPDAWLQQPVSAVDTMTPGPKNRLQAYPYTRMHCSNWNVDQASPLVFCPAAQARELGIAPDKRIHPLASTESNHMMQVSRRASLDCCPGARIAGQRALTASGPTVDQIDLSNLYSCFPTAVEIFAVEFGISPDRPPAPESIVAMDERPVMH